MVEGPHGIAVSCVDRESRKEIRMSQLSDTGRIKSTTGRTTWLRVFVIGEETLRRISGLIQLAFGVLNGLIGLRFLFN